MRSFTTYGWQYDTHRRNFIRKDKIDAGVHPGSRAYVRCVGGDIVQGTSRCKKTKNNPGSFRPCYLKKAVRWARKRKSMMVKRTFKRI